MTDYGWASVTPRKCRRHDWWMPPIVGPEAPEWNYGADGWVCRKCRKVEAEAAAPAPSEPFDNMTEACRHCPTPDVHPTRIGGILTYEGRCDPDTCEQAEFVTKVEAIDAVPAALPPSDPPALDALAALEHLVRVIDNHPEAYRLDTGELGAEYARAWVRAKAAIRHGSAQPEAQPAEGADEPTG